MTPDLFVANVNALCTPSLREVSSEAPRKGTHHLISTHRSRFGACNWVPSSNKKHPSLSHTFKRILPRGGRGDGPVGGLASHPKEISTRTKAAFVYCHLAAITARQNSFFLGRINVLMGPGLGVRSNWVSTQGTVVRG